MNELLSFFTAVFTAFFAVMNPISCTPMFLLLTSDKNSISRKKIALQSVLVAFLITTLFCLLGNKIFSMFGITLAAFKITGGILIMLIGFESLQGKLSPVQTPSIKAHEESSESDLSVAVSPLGTPLLAGPGTITTAVNFVSYGETMHLVLTILSFAVICIMTYICFIFSKEIKKFLGQVGINVVVRLMGLIVAVVGVEMLITGLKAVFPFMN